MKKIILTSLMLCSTFAFSQEIKFGAKGGLNVANLGGDYPKEIVENNSLIGFHIGGFLELNINDKFKLQPEILLSTQGGSAVMNLSDDLTDPQEEIWGSFTQTPKLTYLHIPVMIKYQIIDKLYMEFGPQFGYLINAKSQWKGKDFEDPSYNFTLDIDLLNPGTYDVDGEIVKVDPKTNRFDFGLNLGSSYDISEKLFAQIRYNVGLTTVDKNSTYGTSLDSWNLKNSVLQISMGYKF